MAEIQTDVVVVGSGIGGLCCGAMLARYGFEVILCESHSIPGGAAHGFRRQGFTFDSGPSLYSGLSYSPSPNPLRQVLDAIDEDLTWIYYDTWGCDLPEGKFETSVGADQFCDLLKDLFPGERGQRAVQEWRQLQQIMEPYGRAAMGIPPAALRGDWGVVRTLIPYASRMAEHLFRIGKLTGPFSQIMDEAVQDPFLCHWLDLLCFLLSGLPASSTSAAEMAFMFADWYRPGVRLEYPQGGSEALVNALVRGMEKHGGQLQLNAHVDQVWVESGRAVGVILKSGQQIRARRAVISNASTWDTLKLLPSGSVPASFHSARHQTPACPSFMHLHLGIEGQGIPTDLPCHHMFVNNWEQGITAPQNVVAISIPSLLDPSLAPPGKQVIHVYTPANEPYELWQDLQRGTEAYEQLKQERAEIMWHALERIIPDIRERCEVTLVGTPLTHERFLRRHRGSYGPAIEAGKAIFPGNGTPLPGLLCCGDSTFPGIGLPAVAASGLIAANTLAPLDQHLRVLDQMQLGLNS